MNTSVIMDGRLWGQLALLAVSLGSCLWAWIWLKASANGLSKRQRLFKLSALTLFLCFDLVILGSFTRLSDSGLGCPDWPGCYGWVTPLGASEHIASAQSQMPSGPVTTQKAWIEMVHRYSAMTLGVLIMVLCQQSWVYRRQCQASMNSLEHKQAAKMVILSLITFVWVVVQGLFGALTVTTRLYPLVVSAHWMGGMILLVLLSLQVQAYRSQSSQTLVARTTRPVVPLTWGLSHRVGVQWLFVLCMAALAVQLFLGAWVSTNYAVLACEGFPLCQGQWWPNMDGASGFELWRPLGMTQEGQVMGFDALVAIHWAHRCMAVCLSLMFLWLMGRMHALGMKSWSHWLMSLLCLQWLSGVCNVLLGWPLWSALAHTAGAGALVLCMSFSYRWWLGHRGQVSE